MSKLNLLCAVPETLLVHLGLPQLVAERRAALAEHAPSTWAAPIAAGTERVTPKKRVPVEQPVARPTPTASTIPANPAVHMKRRYFTDIT